MKFELVGTIAWAVGSCRDDRSMPICESIDAPTAQLAIEQAKVIVADLHKGHSHLTDYGLVAQLRMVKSVWTSRFQRAQTARQAVLASPSIPEHFEEQIII